MTPVQEVEVLAIILINIVAGWSYALYLKSKIERLDEDVEKLYERLLD